MTSLPGKESALRHEQSVRERTEAIYQGKQKFMHNELNDLRIVKKRTGKMPSLFAEICRNQYGNTTGIEKN
ncbi:hypothetical protein [Chromobacterium sphagni]|uniref:hypothetical protein n=1 Tax=Chromobacterium sphagni TaxID=1903179 RepID=UPI0019D40E29|nr:hypothetical protein [Chromobacterium sphagni]